MEERRVRDPTDWDESQPEFIVVRHDEAFADATFRVNQMKELGKEEDRDEKRRARMSVGGFVNEWIDEMFHLEYDEARLRMK